MRGEGKEKERERNIKVWEKHWLVASLMSSNQGPNPQPKHVPWLGIEPATFCFAGRCPNNWATAVRARKIFHNGTDVASETFIPFIFEGGEQRAKTKRSIFRDGNMISYILLWNVVESACICGIGIHRFKHPQVENVGESVTFVTSPQLWQACGSKVAVPLSSCVP